MEVIRTEDIVIVGAGIAGLTTSLGLHRLGIRSLVLESSESLRVTGFALAAWTNAWRALDALGVGDSLRSQHHRLQGIAVASTISGLPPLVKLFDTNGKRGEPEVRGTRRKLLLEALEKELPSGTIRYSSKVVSIEEELEEEEEGSAGSSFKLVHLADGSVLKTKVLIGCDGVNSVVAKWLGFKKPAFTSRYAIRACANFKDGHGFEPKFMQFAGWGVRSGFVPCDDTMVYWFFTFSPSTAQEKKEMEESPAKMKEYVLSKLGKVPDQVKTVVEITELDNMICSPLRFRHPWELLRGNISKGNVCVAGDAFHPMTPDLGQGGCSALEDGVVLARCLAEALAGREAEAAKNEEYKRIEMALKKYAKERRRRGIDLISTAYIVGWIQQGDGPLLTFLRDKMLAPFLASLLFKRADFDCGKLTSS